MREWPLCHDPLRPSLCSSVCECARIKGRKPTIALKNCKGPQCALGRSKRFGNSCFRVPEAVWSQKFDRMFLRMYRKGVDLSAVPGQGVDLCSTSGRQNIRSKRVTKGPPGTRGSQFVFMGPPPGSRASRSRRALLDRQGAGATG